VEQDAKEPGGATRSQNVVYVVPHDWASISYFLAPLIERADENVAGLQVLVLTADAEAAAAVAAAAVKMAGGRNVGIVAATAVQRTMRLLKLVPSQVVVGSPETILELVKGSALRLTTLRAVVFAWADSLLGEPGTEEAIATLAADFPKEATRTVATTELTPAVEQLIERYAFRARRVNAGATVDTTPIAIEYLISSDTGRVATLRRALDVIDPSNAAIFVREEDAQRVVGDFLRSLGYSGPDAPVRLSHGGGAPDTVVLFDVPASREELTEAMGAKAKRVIALIQPRQLSTLRALAGGGRLRPIALPDVVQRTRSRDELIRAELRAVLSRGGVGRTTLAIEPLLDEYDAVEIAAAAMELLEQERAKPRPTAAAAEPRVDEGMSRLFISAGNRDGLRTGEVVASIGNDAGVPSSQIGKIEIRDSHSIVEVASAAAQTVIDKLTGRTMAGRRIIVRLDQDAGRSGPPRDARPRREGPPRPREGGRDRPREGGRDRPRDGGRDRPRPRTGGKRP
jgi:ATP-dependent RNA helicase DeaD